MLWKIIGGGILKAINLETPSKELICRYTSGSFKDAERNYHSNEKEYLAKLLNNISGDNKQGRLVRWKMWFSRYSFEVEHIKGEKNDFADFLTREFLQQN
ncbi:hypothetical protein LXL04_005886 [Taraxacum kok-saghyz]